MKNIVIEFSIKNKSIKNNICQLKKIKFILNIFYYYKL